MYDIFFHSFRTFLNIPLSVIVRFFEKVHFINLLMVVFTLINIDI